MCLSGTGQILAPDRDPVDTMMCIPYMLVWLWLHLLILDVGNQRLPEGILEDAANKPWRPMPTGRLSSEETQRLLRALVPISACVGLLFGSFTPSVAFRTLAYLYNDLDASSSGPITRNLLNTAGLSCLGWGAISCLLGGEISSEGSRLLKTWMAVVAAMLLTTVHAQDFPDLVGDHARWRRTVPLVYGIKWSRLVVAVLAIVWSVACAAFWGVCSLGWLVTLALSGGLAISILLPWEKPTTRTCGDFGVFGPRRYTHYHFLYLRSRFTTHELNRRRFITSNFARYSDCLQFELEVLFSPYNSTEAQDSEL